MIKLKTLISLPIFLLLTLTLNAQDTTPTSQSSKWDLGLEGMFGFSVGKDFYSINVGGPSLMLALNKDLKIGIGALPSLYLFEGKLGARLGVSPRIDYKNLVFIAPFFHRDIADQWIGSVGVGYKFHRKN